MLYFLTLSCQESRSDGRYGAAAEVGLSLNEVFEPQNVPG